MEVNVRKYVIRGENGEMFYGVELSRRNFKPDIGWVNNLTDAFKLRYRDALSILSCLSGFCDVSGFSIVPIDEVSG